MVDRWEELAHVTTQRVAILTSKVLAAVQGAMGAFAHPVGVAVVDETPLEDGLDDVAQGVVDDSISERSGADQPPLGLEDEEAVIRARLVGLGHQFLLQAN